MKIFETHSHYDDSDYDDDRDELLSQMLSDEGAIDYIVNIGASIRGCYESVRLANQYDRIYAAVGVHPEDIEALSRNSAHLEWMRQQALNDPKVVAIGEIGLDYHYPEPSKQLQMEMFRQQLKLAKEVKKPIVIHSRDACQDTIDCIRAELGDNILEGRDSIPGGIIHCYSYTKETARIFLEMGFHFGIGGVVTFKNAKKLVEAVEELPLDRLLLETDCPYMAPEPHRGTRNDSRKILYIAEKIAELKGVTAQEIIDITNNNARKLFGI